MRPPLALWDHLPLPQRRRLLWLLSQLLERQLPVASSQLTESGHESGIRVVPR
jgi:hypothetical protein